MSLALRIANAVCEARLRAIASMASRGIDLTKITCRDDGGVDVDGKLACLVMHSREEDVVHIDVVWVLHWERYGADA